MKIEIEEMTRAHLEDVVEILCDGLPGADSPEAKKNLPEPPQWDSQHLDACRLVAVLCNQVVGWAALSAPRGAPSADRADVEVYVRKGMRGAGIGTALLRTLVWEAEEAGLAALTACMGAENRAACALFAGCGFREVAAPDGSGETVAYECGLG